jgi:hypothetical protein
LCGSSITPPCVVWSSAQLLFFHADCAEQLGADLIADGRMAALAGGSESKGRQWRHVAIRIARHWLEAEEGRPSA